jgi:hypothetical protein
MDIEPAHDLQACPGHRTPDPGHHDLQILQGKPPEALRDLAEHPVLNLVVFLWEAFGYGKILGENTNNCLIPSRKDFP